MNQETSLGESAILFFAVIVETNGFNLVGLNMKTFIFWLNKNSKFGTCVVMGGMVTIKREL